MDCGHASSEFKSWGGIKSYATETREALQVTLRNDVTRNLGSLKGKAKEG